jgi:hypothetical protein
LITKITLAFIVNKVASKCNQLVCKFDWSENFFVSFWPIMGAAQFLYIYIYIRFSNWTFRGQQYDHYIFQF